MVTTVAERHWRHGSSKGQFRDDNRILFVPRSLMALLFIAIRDSVCQVRFEGRHQRLSESRSEGRTPYQKNRALDDQR
jgi:hypothetical protein